MIERGSNKHGPHLDDEMKHEVEGTVRGGRPAHVEDFRQTEPFPDDTDSPEVQAAVNPEGVAREDAEGAARDDAEESSSE